jgi:proline iminopeptidase
VSNPTEETVTVRGVEIFTRTVGTGPDVVVLHGGPGAHHDYLLPQYDALAEGRRLRYYDQRGGGRSAAPRRRVPVGWREHVGDLHALLDYWDLSPATLLGHSWGGLLALLYAINHRHRVGRLALVSPAPASAAERRTFERRFAQRMRHPTIQTRRTRLRQSDLRERDPATYDRRMFELSVAGYFADVDQARHSEPFGPAWVNTICPTICESSSYRRWSGMVCTIRSRYRRPVGSPVSWMHVS